MSPLVEQALFGYPKHARDLDAALRDLAQAVLDGDQVKAWTLAMRGVQVSEEFHRFHDPLAEEAVLALRRNGA